MSILVPEANPDYRLLDAGDGRKLETFSGYVVDRPEPGAAWPRTLTDLEWGKAGAVCEKAGRWTIRKPPPEPWVFRWKHLRLRLKLAPYKHTGVFPEQQACWEWLERAVRSMGPEPNVLNLFAYTGGATLACAAAGARVCHVDSSKPAVAWARENQALSGLSDRPVRWIVDDCLKFVTREARRGAKYRGIIMDPPAFGRDPKGRIFRFGRDVPKLLGACRDILTAGPRFLLINAYNVDISPEELGGMASVLLSLKGIGSGRLGLRQGAGGMILPCGFFARHYIPKN